MNELKKGLRLAEAKVRLQNRLVVLGLKHSEVRSLWLDIEELLELAEAEGERKVRDEKV